MTGGKSQIATGGVARVAAAVVGMSVLMLVGCDRAGEAKAPEAAVVADVVSEPLASPAVQSTVRPTVPAPAPVVRSAARVEFDPPILDFGLVLPNTAATGTVQIRNVSDRHVRILTVKSSCKCTTTSDLTGVVIAPGASVPLEAELEAQPITGRRTASISVLIEGATAPFQLDLLAEVTMAVRATPSILNLASGETSGHIVVESVDGRRFNVLSANRLPPVFMGFDPAFDEPRSSYVLRWDLAEETAQNRLDRWWIIETDHPDAPLTDAWVRHMSTIDLTARNRPWQVPSRRSNIGYVDKGGSKNFTIDVQNIGTTDAIYAVRSLTSDFTAELVSYERKGNDAVCTVRVKPKAGFTGLLYGRIEMITTSHAHQQDVMGKVR